MKKKEFSKTFHFQNCHLNEYNSYRIELHEYERNKSVESAPTANLPDINEYGRTESEEVAFQNRIKNLNLTHPSHFVGVLFKEYFQITAISEDNVAAKCHSCSDIKVLKASPKRNFDNFVQHLKVCAIVNRILQKKNKYIYIFLNFFHSFCPEIS